MEYAQKEMSQFLQYLLGPILDKDGLLLPFSRVDVAASVVLALSIMFAFAFSLGGFDHLRLVKCFGAVAVGVTAFLLTRQRRLVLGAALGIVAIRLIFGLIFIIHTLPMLIVTFVCCGSTIALLRKT